LTIGGIVAMTIGSLMLFESPAPFMKLSLAVILPAVVMTTLFFTVLIGLAYKAYRRKPITGSEGLLGSYGIADTEITMEGGRVTIHGEIWSSYSEDVIDKGNRVIVEEVLGLKLKVKKA
jgi:membrane-bound serine protease (ClpP class)